MATSSKTSGQVPPDTVHLNTDVPDSKPVIVVLNSGADVIVPLPEILVHKPPEAAVAAN